MFNWAFSYGELRASLNGPTLLYWAKVLNNQMWINCNNSLYSSSFSSIHIQAYYSPSWGKIDYNFRIETMESCSYTKTIFMCD